MATAIAVAARPESHFRIAVISFSSALPRPVRRLFGEKRRRPQWGRDEASDHAANTAAHYCGVGAGDVTGAAFDSNWSASIFSVPIKVGINTSIGAMTFVPSMGANHS